MISSLILVGFIKKVSWTFIIEKYAQKIPSNQYPSISKNSETDCNRHFYWCSIWSILHILIPNKFQNIFTICSLAMFYNIFKNYKSYRIMLIYWWILINSRHESLQKTDVTYKRSEALNKIHKNIENICGVFWDIVPWCW